MHIRLVRHATLIVEYGGHMLLVDPMLDDAGARPAVQNSPNPRNNPLVPLPESAMNILHGMEAVLVTHTHSDHWDVAAAKFIPKDLPLFGQPEDEQKFQLSGFTVVQSVEKSLTWNGIEITRTAGQHGTREIAKKMAPVSGFVLKAQGEPTIYIAGDTIWCRDVKTALRTHQPKVAVVNAGAARFLQGDPITMTTENVIEVCLTEPAMQVIAVHMESINHCGLTRADLAAKLKAAGITGQVEIPQDGEWMKFELSR